MNLNNLAREICKREGKKKQINIAQIKEIIRVLGEILNEMDGREFADTAIRLLGKVKRRKGKK